MLSMSNALDDAFPTLAAALPRLALATLPTPIESHTLDLGGDAFPLTIKCDDRTNGDYGGNKIRKLEYLLQRARQKNATRVATFGTVASNHALATAIHARAQGLECTCFLSHQHRTQKAALALNTHLTNGTEIVRYGGARPARVATMRRFLQGRNSWVIPMGGSNWLGAVGFVNAGLELVAQYSDQRLPLPDRIYIANGTMASAAGLAIGLALADAATEVHAVRVTHDFIASEDAMRRLIRKTIHMIRRCDSNIPAGVSGRTNIVWRDGFFGDGYARSNSATDEAINIAKQSFGINLEATYTGKAMAALIADARAGRLADKSAVFWNTYSSSPLAASSDEPVSASDLPDEFLRYFPGD